MVFTKSPEEGRSGGGSVEDARGGHAVMLYTFIRTCVNSFRVQKVPISDCSNKKSRSRQNDDYVKTLIDKRLLRVKVYGEFVL